MVRNYLNYVSWEREKYAFTLMLGAWRDEGPGVPAHWPVLAQELLQNCTNASTVSSSCSWWCNNPQ